VSFSEIPCPPPPGYALWEWVVDPIASGLRDARNSSERVLWQISVIDSEIGNGGLHQVHVNHDQGFIDAAVEGLREMAAERHAGVLAEATRLIGDVPAEGDLRREAIDSIAPDRFQAVDDAWYGGEPLADVLERYICSHPDLFF
jgi:hypothetical protein